MDEQRPATDTRSPEEFIASYERDLETEKRPRYLFDYAEALGDVGRRKEALAILERLQPAADSEPKHRRRWSYVLGRTLEAMGKLADAEKAFREYRELYEGTAPSVFLAATLAQQERFEETIEVLTEAVNRKGDPDEVWLNMAFSQRTLGRLEEAAESLRKALAITADYPEAKTLLREVLAAIAVRDGMPAPAPEDDSDAEDPSAEVIIARFEREEDAEQTLFKRFEYADALRQVGRRREAIAIFEDLRISPVPESRRFLIFQYLGHTFLDMGRWSEAEQTFRQGCELDDWGVLRESLAKALAGQERYEEAIEVLTEAVDREGEPEGIWLNLAYCQRALGRWADSAGSLKEVLAIVPGHPKAEALLKAVQAAMAVSHAVGEC